MAFKLLDRNQEVPLPATVNNYVPENHLAKFVVFIVDLLDLSSITDNYKGHGKPAYLPSMLLSLIIYGYITGTSSCRAMEDLTKQSLPYMYICNQTHPHHSTISKFRRNYGDEISELFIQFNVIVCELEELDLENCYLDGTKIKANASQHRAYSYGKAVEIKEKLEKEAIDLVEMNKNVDSASSLPFNIDDEIKRRTNKIAVLEMAINAITERAAQRYSSEYKAFMEKVAARAQKELETGKKTPGKALVPPKEGPNTKDQYNLTDPESRIMPSSNKGFIQGFNGQACVEGKNRFLVEMHLTTNTNDKKEIVPALENLISAGNTLHADIERIIADAGYYSEDNVKACENNNIEPLIATGRLGHYPSLTERFPLALPVVQSVATTLEKMKHKLTAPEGKEVYKKRKEMIEPVFGVIKDAMNFTRFRLRGLKKVPNEWILVGLCYNIKKLYNIVTSKYPDTPFANVMPIS
jgi:transposase